MALFDKIKAGLARTRSGIAGTIGSIFSAFTGPLDNFLEELEDALIMADVGAELSAEITDKLRKTIKEKKIKNGAEVREELISIVSDIMAAGEGELKLDSKPSVILVIGVNGVGKTTTIGKLAGNFTREGKKVLLAAGDTFRAAAADQLQIWADRAGCQVIRHNEGADPAAVVFDAINAAKARNTDILICDTAGRLHNKVNLMNELSKINRIIHRELPDTVPEVLLVVDATTGQNALNQAIEFKKAADITGVVLTKLDGTAKGGIAVAICRQLGVPVKRICVGEKIEDMLPFDGEAFARALFE